MIQLEAGMVFASSNPQGLGKAINTAQRFYSYDQDSTYGHSGIIQDSEGTTFEARWTLGENNLYELYSGERILIARPLVDEALVQSAIKDLKAEHLGQWYPGWRLLLFLIPPVARRVSYGGHFVVCSELVAKYEHLLGIRHEHFTGTTPDNLVDEWRHWSRQYEIVFEGILE